MPLQRSHHCRVHTFFRQVTAQSRLKNKVYLFLFLLLFLLFSPLKQVLTRYHFAKAKYCLYFVKSSSCCLYASRYVCMYVHCAYYIDSSNVFKLLAYFLKRFNEIDFFKQFGSYRQFSYNIVYCFYRNSACNIYICMCTYVCMYVQTSTFLIVNIVHSGAAHANNWQLRAIITIRPVLTRRRVKNSCNLSSKSVSVCANVCVCVCGWRGKGSARSGLKWQQQSEMKLHASSNKLILLFLLQSRF